MSVVVGMVCGRGGGERWRRRTRRLGTVPGNTFIAVCVVDPTVVG